MGPSFSPRKAARCPSRPLALGGSFVYGSDAGVDVETIAATIDAYAQGKIKLEEVDPSIPKHMIYHVSPTGDRYTAATLARFLGWTRKHSGKDVQATDRCRRALDLYHSVVAPGIVTLSDLVGISSTQGQAVARFLGWVKPSTQQPTAGCRAAFDAYRERAPCFCY